MSIFKTLSSIGSESIRLFSAMLSKGPAAGKLLPTDGDCDILVQPQCQEIVAVISTDHVHQEVTQSPADQAVVEQILVDQEVHVPSIAVVDAEPVPETANQLPVVTPCPSSSSSDSAFDSKRPRDLESALQSQLAKLTDEHVRTSVGLGEDRPMLSLSEWHALQMFANQFRAGRENAFLQLNASLKPVWEKVERDNRCNSQDLS
eukprot:CAMPEP_0196668086 /NCGR_PEP_ID=MMETSP1086-20130531/65434_1 /TAXON_ID=77921 /ORGANISM="Cyanoptyche  gloeocystis , Strain SAG4.97" /LENGTH=203 /DNA_ID=CAMNT_0042005471 /DNA_START=24 /DNA_END=635 /DNA_ORIENTATION=-